MKRPNKILYSVLNRVARIYTLLAKNHHFHNPQKIKIKTPAIVISNHTSFFDFLYVMWALKNTPINFVVARKYCETKPLSNILKFGKVIPKSLFQSDTLAIKQMLEVIKQKGVIGIFPEGQISVTGVTLEFPSGTGKLVKKCGCDVYAVRTTGAYLMDPPWTNVHRQGRIDSTLNHIIKAEEIEHLSVEMIEEKLYQSIYTNPYIENNNIKFKGKNLAIGLDKLLYTCLHCHEEGKIKSINNLLKCEACHHEYVITADGRLVGKNEIPMTIFDAYQKQRQIELVKIMKTEEYEFTCDVKVESIVNQRYQIVSQGKLLVNKKEIRYESNDEYAFSISSKAVRYVPFDNGRNFQIYRNNHLYQFIPKEGYISSKAANIIELIYEIGK